MFVDTKIEFPPQHSLARDVTILAFSVHKALALENYDRLAIP